MIQLITQKLPFTDVMFAGNLLAAYIEGLMIIIGFYIIGLLIKYIIFRSLSKLASKTVNQFDDLVINEFSKIIVWLTFMIGVVFVLYKLNIQPKVFQISINLIYIFMTIKFTFMLNNIVSMFCSEIVIPYSKKHKMLDEEIIGFLSKLFKGLIWVIMGMTILSIAGYNVSSLVAGLGIGGLAIALAAQATLANFFSSIYIFSDRPFKVGDFVSFDGVKATIKEVGMRSTRMETIDGTKLMVPNNQLASTKIENISKRKSTRVDFKLGIAYSTSHTKVEEAIQIIKDIIKEDKETEDECRVHFLAFGENTLEICVMMHVLETKEYTNILNIRSRVNLKIKEKYEKAKITIDFPSRNLYIKDAINIKK